MQILEHLIQKLHAILQTCWGWAVWLSIFLMDYFAGHSFIVGLVVAVTLMDACWGIAVSVRQGHFTLSELARHTVAKITVYGCAMFVFVGLDKITHASLTAAVVGSAIVLVEFWSSCASMLILFPHLLFLRLLRKALTGEIAAKLHIREEDVEKALGSGEIKVKSEE